MRFLADENLDFGVVRSLRWLVLEVAVVVRGKREQAGLTHAPLAKQGSTKPNPCRSVLQRLDQPGDVFAVALLDVHARHRDG